VKIKIVNENCDPTAAQDTSLPCTAYLIGYQHEGRVKFDIAIASKKADIFDHYWDTYRSVVSMTQTEGRVNPKLWSPKGG
tara:strand:+ start:1006 stop:1245 length:240 start_codon:yes stop_codon:yes gene_type:complete